MENKLKKYKIYSLRSYNDKSVIYYDYTKQFLHKRLSAIKSRYTRYLNNMDNYMVAFELFKLGNVYIELEEELECINREHLNAVLNKYIRDNDCLNKSYYEDTAAQVCNDNNVILTNKTDNINTDKITDKIDNINTLKEIKPPTTSGIVKEPLKEIKPPTTSGIVKEPIKEIKPPTTSGIVKEPIKDKLNIQPPTINNIKTIDINYKQKYLYSNNDDNNSIKSLASSVIKSNSNNDDNNSIKSLASSVIKSNRNKKTIKIDFTTHSKTLKKKWI